MDRETCKTDVLLIVSYICSFAKGTAQSEIKVMCSSAC